MGDWERTFGEAGMKAGFIESMTKSWESPDRSGKEKITLFFDTAADALSWAKEHPGCAITRHPTDEGYIARTWRWRFDDGDLFGTKENVRDSQQQIKRRNGIIKNAGQIMQQHTYEGAEWLFYSGYETLLTTLYEEARGAHQRSFAEEKTLRDKLLNLLPKAMEGINMYEVRHLYEQSKGNTYQMKRAVSGWIGEDEPDV